MSLKKYLEKSAEQVDFDALPDLEDLPSGDRWWGTTPAIIAASSIPFFGRGIGRWLRGGAYNAGRRVGFNPVAKWQMNRGKFSPSAANRELGRATTYSNSQKGWFGNSAVGKLKDKIFRDPYLRGRYGSPKLFGKKVDNLSRIVLPKTTGMQSVYGTTGLVGTLHGSNLNLKDNLNAAMALNNHNVSAQIDAKEKGLIDQAIGISNRLQMPGILGAAAGAGLGGILGSSLTSNSRKEKIRNIARIKGISEEEASKLVGEDDSTSGWLGAGLGGVGGFLLANKMYPTGPKAVLESADLSA